MKRILHIIESLQPGGAENLLCNTVSELTEYEHLIVTVFATANLSLLPKNAAHISLDARSKTDIFFKSGAYKKIIRQFNPSFVHAHLYFATVLAKALTPINIPVIFTQHFEFSKNATKWYYQFVDRIVSTRQQVCLAVSNVVLKDYVAMTGFKGKKQVVGIYIPDRYFVGNQPSCDSDRGHLKIVALGNIKPIKNQRYLLDAFTFLKDLPVSCDVYGEGSDRLKLENEARAKKLNVFFKGPVTDSATILSRYHLYIMPSLTEGFPLALFEAMAMGLSPIVSDIPVFHELLEEDAHYIPLQNPKALRAIIEGYLQNPSKLDIERTKAKIIAGIKASKTNYLRKLREIYTTAVADRN